MTKRERLSFALRRLRTVKAQPDVARRLQDTHELIKEMMDELSKGTQNADLGEHTIQLLDELYAQNTGAIEDGRLPAPPAMPDLAEPIRAQTQAVQAIPSEDAAALRTDTAVVLRQTLSLFAQGPNEAPLVAFLQAVDDQMQRANALPPPMPDCSAQLDTCLRDLSSREGLEAPDAVREAAVSCLRDALSVFAQGPNQTPIETALERCTDRLNWANAQPASIPDHSEQMQLPIDALSNRSEIDTPLQRLEAAIHPLCQALSVFAHGPNEQPIQTVLDKVYQAVEQANALPPPLPDYSPLLQPHLDALEALATETAPEGRSPTETTLLGRMLSTFAQGPNAHPIQRALAAMEQIETQHEASRWLSHGADSLQPHIEALMALQDVADPDALTAAAAMTLYDALAEMAQGPNAAPIQTLLDTFDQVIGAG